MTCFLICYASPPQPPGANTAGSNSSQRPVPVAPTTSGATGRVRGEEFESSIRGPWWPPRGVTALALWGGKALRKRGDCNTGFDGLGPSPCDANDAVRSSSFPGHDAKLGNPDRGNWAWGQAWLEPQGGGDE